MLKLSHLLRDRGLMAVDPQSKQLRIFLSRGSGGSKVHRSTLGP